MKGTVRIYLAKRYLDSFVVKRTMVWIAVVHGLDGNVRHLACSIKKQHVVDCAAAETSFTGFPLVTVGRDEAQDAGVRE